MEKNVNEEVKRRFLDLSKEFFSRITYKDLCLMRNMIEKYELIESKKDKIVSKKILLETHQYIDMMFSIFKDFQNPINEPVLIELIEIVKGLDSKNQLLCTVNMIFDVTYQIKKSEAMG